MAAYVLMSLGHSSVNVHSHSLELDAKQVCLQTDAYIKDNYLPIRQYGEIANDRFLLVEVFLCVLFGENRYSFVWFVVSFTRLQTC